MGMGGGGGNSCISTVIALPFFLQGCRTPFVVLARCNCI